MSLPTEADFALIKMGDGEATEAFTAICGMQNASVNWGVNTTDRFVRDCAKPGEVPWRKPKATGKQVDVTGSGFTDKTEIGRLTTALGQVKNYKVELYSDDGTDAGTLVGTIAGAFMLNAENLNIPRDGDATAEITMASSGPATWTAA